MTFRADILTLAVRKGEEAGVRWALIPGMGGQYPCVNGYVELPPDNALRVFGDDYELMNEAVDLDAPGWLTYADGDWIGFDTVHFTDRWPEAELAEVMTIEPWMKQVLEMWDRIAKPEWVVDWSIPLLIDRTREVARNVAKLTPGDRPVFEAVLAAHSKEVDDGVS